jgi:hypothetical protein
MGVLGFEPNLCALDALQTESRAFKRTYIGEEVCRFMPTERVMERKDVVASRRIFCSLAFVLQTTKLGVK